MCSKIQANTSHATHNRQRITTPGLCCQTRQSSVLLFLRCFHLLTSRTPAVPPSHSVSPYEQDLPLRTLPSTAWYRGRKVRSADCNLSGPESLCQSQKNKENQGWKGSRSENTECLGRGWRKIYFFWHRSQGSEIKQRCQILQRNLQHKNHGQSLNSYI